MDRSKSEIESFLHAIDDELAKAAGPGERLELYLLGRSALILRLGLALGTKDVDFARRAHVPELERKALQLFAEGTPNALKWGLSATR